jgi:glycosyltransferase involved in cell wall biosynthesis
MHLAVLSDPSNFHTRKWAQGLAQAGVQVTVFSYTPHTVPGVPCVQVPPPRGLGRRLHYGWYLWGGRVLREALEAHRVEVINPVNITPYGVWAARAGVRPVVSVAMGADVLSFGPPVPPGLVYRNKHNPEGQASPVRWLAFHLRRRFYRHHVRRALAASDLVTGDNRVLTDALERYFDVPPERIRLNRWGLEPERLVPDPARIAALRTRFGLREGVPVVCSPRGVTAVYQGDVILAAFARLLDQGRTDVHYLMFSAGYGVPEGFRRAAATLQARHPGFGFSADVLDRTDMLQLWHLVDVFVSAPVYDGFSSAVNEGRYVGAVPVVNATAATHELFRHQVNGWLVDPFTPRMLAEALATVLNDLPRWKARFAPPNRRWVEENALLPPNIARFVTDCQMVLG